MKRIGVFANMEKPSAKRALAALSRQCGRFGLTILDLNRRRALSGRRIDAVLVLGGDGTMLKAIRMLNGREAPVLGVNLGNLGFLTSVSEDDIETALRRLANGEFTVSPRALLECVVKRSGKTLGRYRALNDVVITRGASARIITLDILINGAEVLSCKGDGLIVSTPTGSTGHSLSAGGPILHPDAAVCVLSLICPHTLSARPLVVPDGKKITVVAAESAGDLSLFADGQVGMSLKSGDRVDVYRSGKNARFVHLPGYSYYSVLSQKLHWRGSTL